MICLEYSNTVLGKTFFNQFFKLKKLNRFFNQASTVFIHSILFKIKIFLSTDNEDCNEWLMVRIFFSISAPFRKGMSKSVMTRSIEVDIFSNNLKPFIPFDALYTR